MTSRFCLAVVFDRNCIYSYRCKMKCQWHRLKMPKNVSSNIDPPPLSGLGTCNARALWSYITLIENASLKKKGHFWNCQNLNGFLLFSLRAIAMKRFNPHSYYFLLVERASLVVLFGVLWLKSWMAALCPSESMWLGWNCVCKHVLMWQ